MAADGWRAGAVVDGRYRVVGEIGRGGMGVVHRVRHLGWDVEMAVKSALEKVFRSADGQELFVQEAQAWVSLGLHPNICVCYYVRLLDGVPRVFAEYVPGGSLREWIDDGRLYADGTRPALARILDVAIQVARGLGHAHAKGLVHQDVKPANVLLDHSGTAKITDFGLARSKAALAASAAVPAPGDLSVAVTNGGMTPAYASPEQLAGRPLRRRSDIYSFAVLVLEMFTGGVFWAPGLAGSTLADMVADRDDPLAVPPRLAELLAACLRSDPDDRPSSMTAVAEQLAGIYQETTQQRYPRPASAEATMRADELNNRGLSLLDLGEPQEAGKAFAAALAVDPHHVGAVYNAGLLQWRSGAISDVELVGRLSELCGYPDSSWTVRHLLAQVHLERGDLEAARGLLDALTREQPASAARTAPARAALESGRIAEAHRVSRVQTLTRIRKLQRPPVRLLARHKVSGYLDRRFTVDGRLAVTGHWDGRVRLWDVAGDKLLRVLKGHRGQVMSVDIDAAGHVALSTGYDATVRRWDLRTGRCVATHPAGRSTWLNPIRLSADGRVGVWVGATGRIEAWDLGSGTLLRHLGRPWRNSLVDPLFEVSADGEFVLTAEEGGARVWAPALGGARELATGAAPSTPRAMCFGGDGRYAAVAGTDRTIRVWDLAEPRCVRTLTGHATSACTLAMSGDMRHLLSAGADGTVRYWDLATGRCLRTFTDQGGGPEWVTLPGDDARLALSVDKDRVPTLSWWRLPDGGHTAEAHLSRPREYAEVSRLSREVDALLAQAGQALGQGSATRTVLDLLTRARAVPGYERAPQVLAAWRDLGRTASRVGLRAAWSGRLTDGEFPFGDVVGLGLSADGRLAVTGHSKGAVRVWDLERGTRTALLTGHRIRAGVVALSADGRRVQCFGGSTISRWQVDIGERSALSVDRTMARTVRFTADGRQALFGDGGVIRRWDLEEDRCLATATGPRGGINDISLGTDGHRRDLAAVGDSTGAVRLWDLGSAEILRSWHGHGEPVLSVCLSPDGRRAMSTCMDDPTIRLWDSSSEQCLRTFEGHEGWVYAVRFTPDGQFAVSSGYDNTLRLWDVETGRCLHVLEGHEAAVRHFEISADGHRLLSAGDDGLRLWHLDWNLAVPHDQSPPPTP